MTREEARERVKAGISCLDYLKKSKSGLYECPRGEHGNGTGAVKYYPETNTWYCHQCGKGGDVLDLMQLVDGMSYNDALEAGAQQLGFTFDKYRVPQERQEPRRSADKPTADYTEYFKKCMMQITDPAAASYLNGRGISIYTAAAYFVGYDPAADPANAPGAMKNEYKPHPAPRIILPTNSSHYVGRAIDPKNKYAKINSKDSTPGVFNEDALYRADAVFITEGVFDALSILEVGAQAIALNSTANTELFLKRMEAKPTTAALILAFDQDETGRKYTQPLREGLDRLNISHIDASICKAGEDPNDALIRDRAAFIAAVKRDQMRAKTKPDNTALYIDQLMGEDIERFRKAGDLKTGFSNLDEKAGGLFSGLYVLAATSSLGKTTFALQLADQLAGAGHDVIFFSLEQSRLELVSKSIARITAQQTPQHAYTALQIRQGYKSDEILDAIADYKESVGDRLSIVEGNFNCTLSFIGDYVRQYIRQNGEEHRPIVILDYLQILTPEKDERGRAPSTKEAVDAAVTGLKRLSREQDLTVIAISSVNRANYMTPIDFESLKESGGIEFSCDCIWGLQLACVNDDMFSREGNIKDKREKIKAEKAKTPRQIELVCLKNRFGISSFTCNFDYLPANDLFVIADKQERRPAPTMRL